MPQELPVFEPSKGFEYTQPPNPGWKYGQPVETTPEGRAWAEGEKAGWKVVDASKENSLYSLLLSGIVPRPVALISSISPDGTGNLAPFSWFNQVSSSPPVISFSCVHSSKGAKDSLNNILSTKGFTANIISEPWIEQANSCSVDAPPEISEWVVSGLTQAASIYVKAPRVRESAFSMECELLQAVDVRDPSSDEVATTLVLGLIKYIHIRRDIIEPQRGIVDPAKFKPIARMAGLTYARVTEGYTLSRPSWSKEESVIRTVLESKEQKLVGRKF